MANKGKEIIKIEYQIDDLKFKKKIKENDKLIKKSTKLINQMGKKVSVNGLSRLKTSINGVKIKASSAKKEIRGMGQTVKVTGVRKLRNKIKLAKHEAKKAKKEIKNSGKKVNTTGVDNLISKLLKAKKLAASLAGTISKGAIAGGAAAAAVVFSTGVGREQSQKEIYSKAGQPLGNKIINAVNKIIENSSLTDYGEIANGIGYAVKMGIKDSNVLQGLAINQKYLGDSEMLAKGMFSIKQSYKGTSDEQAYETIKYLDQNFGRNDGEIAENFAEYMPYFKKAGYTLNEAAEKYAIGVESGIYQTDKIGDVLKEQQLAFTDKSQKKDFKSLNKIGINGEDFFNNISSGKTNIKDANKLFFKKLNESDLNQNDKDAFLMDVFRSQGEDVTFEILGKIFGGGKSKRFDTKKLKNVLQFEQAMEGSGGDGIVGRGWNKIKNSANQAYTDALNLTTGQVTTEQFGKSGINKADTIFDHFIESSTKIDKNGKEVDSFFGKQKRMYGNFGNELLRKSTIINNNYNYNTSESEESIQKKTKNTKFQQGK